VRHISTLKLKRNARKGCEIYFVHIYESKEEMVKYFLSIDPIPQEFQDVFLEEIPQLLLRRDIYFTIDLVPRYTSVSKAPYKMSTLDLTKPIM
jgi:hypothetical protein